MARERTAQAVRDAKRAGAEGVGDAPASNPRTLRVRRSLLDATFKLVGERPVGELTLSEIAQAAGVSRPTVYKQFTDVPTLAAAAAVRFMRQIFDRIDDRIEVGDDRAYLVEMMRLFIDEVYRERTFCRNAMYGPSAATIAAEVADLIRERMSGRLVGRRLSAHGTLAAEDEMAALSAGVIWLLTRWLASDFEGDNAPDRMAQRIAGTLFQLSGAE